MPELMACVSRLSSETVAKLLSLKEVSQDRKQPLFKLALIYSKRKSSNCSENSQHLIASTSVTMLVRDNCTNLASQAVVVASVLHAWSCHLEFVFPVTSQHVAVPREVKNEAVQRSRRSVCDAISFSERILSEPAWWSCLVLIGFRKTVHPGIHILHLLKGKICINLVSSMI